MRQVLAFALGPIGVAALGLLAVPIMAWSFSQEDVGRLALFQVVISFSWLFLSLGLDQSYVRTYFEAPAKIRLLKSVAYPGVVLGVCLAFAGWQVVSPLSHTLFSSDLFFGFDLVVAVAIFSTYIVNFLSLTLRMEMRGLAYSTVQIVTKLIFVCILFLLYINDVRGGFKELAIATVVSIFATCLILFSRVRIFSLIGHAEKFDCRYSLRLLKYGFPLLVSSLIFWGVISVDRVLLANYSSISEVGLYSVSVNFAAPAQILLGIFSTILAPVVFGWLDKADVKKKLTRVARFSVVSVVVLWLVICLVSEVIDYILPLEYIKVKHILLLCMAYPLLYGLSEVGGIGINVKKKTGYMVLITATCLTFNISLNVVLIPRFGAAGAAAASAVTFFMYFVIRCEIGSYLWFRVFGFREYILISLIMVNCIAICFGVISVAFFNYLSLALGILTAMGYWGVIKDARAAIS